MTFLHYNQIDRQKQWVGIRLYPLLFLLIDLITLSTGDLLNEDKVLEWLVANKNTGDDDDTIDDVTLGLLNTLIDSMDHLAVVFCKSWES